MARGDTEPVLAGKDAAAPTLEQARSAGLLPAYADCEAYLASLRQAADARNSLSGRWSGRHGGPLPGDEFREGAMQSSHRLSRHWLYCPAIKSHEVRECRMTPISIGGAGSSRPPFTETTRVTSWNGSGPGSCRDRSGTGRRPRRPTAPYPTGGYLGYPLCERSAGQAKYVTCVSGAVLDELLMSGSARPITGAGRLRDWMTRGDVPCFFRQDWGMEGRAGPGGLRASMKAR